MAAFLGWLQTPSGVAFCALSYALVCYVASRHPDSPFWTAVRSALTDYKRLNLKALPANVAASLEYDNDPGAIVVLSIDGREVKRLRVSL